ncbi:ketosteroid isomerase family protein [Nocardia sp. 348MFTsu5.1]|uniref:ketosteroid isomerase family protein n=1 Tax=Nocardia sp. 348MFTsu5.1 TaxID=1172185 RepID=UPI00049003F0|nr:ketosteroid isomerase family protein [Nocardia sp. 348MFTsu5.1]
MATYGRDRMLALVERSPAAAGVHDRDAWVGLFVDVGTVNDPVGSRAHVGVGEIERFYDTFIGPRNITFHRDVDVVGEHSVIRDLELEVEMSPKVTLRVPVFIRYDLQESDGALRITRLAAFWELPGMITQFMRCGVAAGPVGVKLTLALLRNQGIRGTFGFAQGFRRVGAGAKSAVENFLDAASRGDVRGARRLLDPHAQLVVLGDETGDVECVVGQLLGVEAHKLLAAGDTVAVALKLGDRKGVGFFVFGTRRGSISAVEMFFGE